MPTYAVLRGLTLKLSSLLTSIMLFSSIFGGLSGRVVDVVRNKVMLVVVLTLVGTLPLALIITLNPIAIVIVGALLGYTNELALTTAYALVAKHENPALSLATLNALNMIIGMWLSVVFFRDHGYIAIITVDTDDSLINSLIITPFATR